jgi:hypothetical protein
MEKYRLVQEHKADESDEYFDPPAATGSTGDVATSSGSANTGDFLFFPEVRITQQGKPRNYISYAMNLFVRVSCPVAVSFLLKIGDLVASLVILLFARTESGRFPHNCSQGHGTRHKQGRYHCRNSQT